MKIVMLGIKAVGMAKMTAKEQEKNPQEAVYKKEKRARICR